MIKCGGAVSLLAVLCLSTQAYAVSITNRDDKPHKVTVISGTTEQSHTIAPLAVLEGVCTSACIIRLNDSADDEYELEGTEVVSIEDSFLYYDGTDGAPAAGTPAPDGAAPAAPKSPDTTTPEAPKKL